MSNINIGRLLLGGILAGLVLNIGEFVLNDVILGSHMKSFMTQHNFPDPGGSFIAFAVLATFFMGIVLVLMYACIRTRLGPGVKTAIWAGLFAWFGIYFYSGIINSVMFGIPMSTMVIVIVWGLVEYALAAIAGAWIYKEA
ncbi:MAG TPA: hypothetical protein VMS31_19280 [Pyrinomonadaceae bacterium]|nr:hypothetical protein [Pyrinomonadaceae bacterium]